LPEHGRLLGQIEKRLRQPKATTVDNEVEMMKTTHLWTTHSLYEALKEEVLFSNDEATLELIEASDASLLLTMREYGDLPIYLTVAGEQIIVESVLWPGATVTDSGAFNEEVLKTHKLFPLSTISLDLLADGQHYYTMFGALSATSNLSNVVFEIEVLADNVIKATEAYEGYLEIAAA